MLLGHRRVMLAATRELGSPAAPLPAREAMVEPKPQDTAERRQVTVMFSDLVGSTALSAQMDPEDLREIISAYQNCVAETVQRFGGFVAKYMGDGVLVYFGYRQAHEDDAERAVRAGLELIPAVGGLTRPDKCPERRQTTSNLLLRPAIMRCLCGGGDERPFPGERQTSVAMTQSRRCGQQ